MKANTTQNTFKRSVSAEKLIRVKLIFILLLIFIKPGFASDPSDCEITCPSDINVSTASGLCDVNVSFPPLVTSGDCIGITYSPADGSSFHVGSTPVTVTTSNGESCTFNVNVTATPITGGIMQGGPNNVCIGSSYTYCVPPAQGAVLYNWTIPAGTTGSSNTNCITITIGPNFTSGTLIVTAFSDCGSGTSAGKILDVVLAPPAKSAAINPGGPVCAGDSQYFCATFVPGTEEYVFSIGGNGQNAPLTLGQQIGTCIYVKIPAGYNNKQHLKVKGINCMGQSDETKLTIKVTDVPNMPGNITGPVNVCHSQFGFYSINNVVGATLYNWFITNDVWIAGGQGTTNLALDFSTSTATSALLSVTAENGCGISAPRTKAIAINTACREASELSSEETLIDIDATVYPNPTGGRVTLQFNSANNSKYTLNVYDMMGRIVFTRDLAVTEGLNQFDFDFSSLPKQVYLLRVGNENGSKIVRLGVE